MTVNAPQKARCTWKALAGLSLIGLAMEAGCAPDESDGDHLSDEVRAALQDMLEDVWPEVISIHLDAARTATVSLGEAVHAWTTEPSSDEARGEAQDAWREAMAAWQETEMMQLGPAGDSLTVTGGESLRDEIYSWPLTNPLSLIHI